MRKRPDTTFPELPYLFAVCLLAAAAVYLYA